MSSTTATSIPQTFEVNGIQPEIGWLSSTGLSEFDMFIDYWPEETAETAELRLELPSSPIQAATEETQELPSGDRQSASDAPPLLGDDSASSQLARPTEAQSSEPSPPLPGVLPDMGGVAASEPGGEGPEVLKV